MCATLAAIVLGTTLAGVSACASADSVVIRGVQKIEAQCISADAAEQALKAHDESLMIIAIHTATSVVELYSDGRGDTWSLILHHTAPENVRCLVLSGVGLVEVKNFIEKGLASN
jgi:hypothetical protein